VWVFLAPGLLGGGRHCDGGSVARYSEQFGTSVSERVARATSRLRDFSRSAFTSHGDVDIDLAGSATVNAQFWLNRFPVRPTAGWAILAGLLSAGVMTRPLHAGWDSILLLWLLADPLWGSLWRLAGGRTEILPLRERDLNATAASLPYFEPGSPAEMVLGQDNRNVLHLVFRVGLPTLAMILAVAIVLGASAVWLTMVVVTITAIGWIGRHTRGSVPAVLHSAVTIGLPWCLTLLLLGVDSGHDGWRILIGLVLLWFLHNWGEMRVLGFTRDVPGIALLAGADIGIALLLVYVQQPIWLVVLILLWLPTWLTISRRQPAVRLNIWWLLAMLASAIAVSQSLSV
jgi:hypothetical protein